MYDKTRQQQCFFAIAGFGASNDTIRGRASDNATALSPAAVLMGITNMNRALALFGLQ
jgi:hypothetical protein